MMKNEEYSIDDLIKIFSSYTIDNGYDCVDLHRALLTMCREIKSLQDNRYRFGANQNIDPDYVDMVKGLNYDELGEI